jgi:hypothetical protein
MAVNLIRLATAIKKETKIYNINRRFGLNWLTIERYNSINTENSSLYSTDVSTDISTDVISNAYINVMPINAQSIRLADNFFIIIIIEYISSRCTNNAKPAEISHVLNWQKRGKYINPKGPQVNTTSLPICSL